MALRLVNTGEVYSLGVLVNKVQPADLILHLAQAAFTPADTDEAGDYTEADFDGYAQETLDGGAWLITAGAPSEAIYPPVIWTRASSGEAQTIYGYYLTNGDTGELIWAEEFPLPQTITESGQEITVVPRITAADDSD